jgi:hypothetical protein
MDDDSASSRLFQSSSSSGGSLRKSSSSGGSFRNSSSSCDGSSLTSSWNTPPLNNPTESHQQELQMLHEQAGDYLSETNMMKRLKKVGNKEE